MSYRRFYLRIAEFREIRRSVILQTFGSARKRQASHEQHRQQSVREKRREIDDLYYIIRSYVTSESDEQDFIVGELVLPCRSI